MPPWRRQERTGGRTRLVVFGGRSGIRRQVRGPSGENETRPPVANERAIARRGLRHQVSRSGSGVMDQGGVRGRALGTNAVSVYNAETPVEELNGAGHQRVGEVQRE